MTTIKQCYEIDNQEQQQLIEVICELKLKYSHDKVIRIAQILYQQVVNGKIYGYEGNLNNKIHLALKEEIKSEDICKYQSQNMKFYKKKMKSLWQKYDSIHFVNSWTKTNELQFLHLYLKQQKIGIVRNQLRAKYGLTQVFQNVREITFRFYKTIRFCLNRLHILIKMYPKLLPQILPYKSDVINKIMISPTTIQIRLKLIRIHLMPQEDDMQLIKQAILAINNFIISLGQKWWKDGYNNWIETDLDINA